MKELSSIEAELKKALVKRKKRVEVKPKKWNKKIWKMNLQGHISYAYHVIWGKYLRCKEFQKFWTTSNNSFFIGKIYLLNQAIWINQTFAYF